MIDCMGGHEHELIGEDYDNTDPIDDDDIATDCGCYPCDSCVHQRSCSLSDSTSQRLED